MKDRRIKAIKELRELCALIGCNGMSPDMCKNRPDLCNIIRKVIKK